MTATINGQVRRELASFQPSTMREKEEQDARNSEHCLLTIAGVQEGRVEENVGKRARGRWRKHWGTSTWLPAILGHV
jgi:hypothetical protein